MIRAGTLMLLVLVWVAGSPASAAEDESSRDSLKGLLGVAVIVERDALLPSTIQTDVELRLRLAGIAIVPGTPSGALLYVTMHAIQSDQPRGHLYAYSVDVEVMQMVTHVRDRDVPRWAVTWSANKLIAMFGGTAFAANVRERVGDRVDVFVNAYLAANPKR